MSVRSLIVTVLMAAALPALAQEAANKPNTNWPGYQEGDYIIRNYKFVSGESLPEVKLHYRAIGTARRNAAGEVVNAVLLLQGNTGTGANWFRPTLADELFKPGQPLDPAKYYIIMPDALGRGGSSKPSDGLKGQFPHYRYHDMVDLTHRLVTDGLKVAHLRLIIGSSLGCMQQFLWAEWYPDLMDGTVGLSCQPVEISGRNYMLRHAAAELIRHDPAWNNGDYDKTPTLYMYAAAGNDLTESPVRIQEEAPTMEAARALYDKRLATIMKDSDANNTLYELEIDLRLQPRGRPAQDQSACDADQQCRGFRRPADARHGRTRIQEDRARHLRVDPLRQGHARAFHALLRGDLEAVSCEIHIRPAAGTAGGPMTAVFWTVFAAPGCWEEWAHSIGLRCCVRNWREAQRVLLAQQMRMNEEYPPGRS